MPDGWFQEEERFRSSRKPETAAEFEAREDVLIIRAADIKDEERQGDVPRQGYVWQD